MSFPQTEQAEHILPMKIFVSSITLRNGSPDVSDTELVTRRSDRDDRQPPLGPRVDDDLGGRVRAHKTQKGVDFLFAIADVLESW